MGAIAELMIGAADTATRRRLPRSRHPCKPGSPRRIRQGVDPRTQFQEFGINLVGAPRAPSSPFGNFRPPAILSIPVAIPIAGDPLSMSTLLLCLLVAAPAA